MDNANSWAQALNISNEQIKQWNSVKPPELPLSFWCLQEGLLDSQSFLDWSREHYQLPSLSPEFINNESLSHVWSQYKEVGIWSQHLLPLHFWDGVLYIACVEPNLNLNLSFPVKYILTTYDSLKQLWSIFHTTQTPQIPLTQNVLPIPVTHNKVSQTEDIPELHSQSTSAPAAEAPEGFGEMPSVPNESILEASSPDLQSFDDTTTNAQMPEGLSMPEGLEFKIEPSTEISNDLLSTNIQTEEFPLNSQAPEGFADDMPEGLSLPGDSPILGPIGFEETVTMEPTTNTATVKLDHAHAENFTQTTTNTKASQNAPSPAQNTSSTESIVNNSQINSPPPVATSAPNSTASNFSIVDPSTLNIENNPTVEAIFKELQNKFTHVLFLRQNGNSLTPEVWNLGWYPKSTQEVFELDKPSLFRIVIQSKKPFHGKPHPCELNDSFFQLWGTHFGESKYPEHCTAVPIASNENSFLGILLLAGPIECNNPSHLSFAEAASKNLAHHLLKPLKATG